MNINSNALERVNQLANEVDELHQSITNETSGTERRKRKRSNDADSNLISYETADILDPNNAKSKVKEKRKSAMSHFEHYLSLRNETLLKENKPTGPTKITEMAYEDFNTGSYMTEFAHYVANNARKYMKSNEELISYATASGYMGAIKNLVVDQYKMDDRGTPNQFSADIWKRYMHSIRSIKWEQCRRKKSPLFGSKESASDADRLGLFAICMWSGTLENAEFMNFFQSMVMNCGRGSEIGLSRFDHLKLKSIKEDNGSEYSTLVQYINRTKVMGKLMQYETLYTN